MADSRDILGKNRKFTGTDGIQLPQGSTAERVASGSADKGKIRFNNTTNLAEYYDGIDWKAIDAPPVITGFTLDGGGDVTTAVIDGGAGGNATIEVKGSLFDTTGAIVTFEGTSETLSTVSITRNSANLLTVTVARSGFDNTNEPYAIKVTNGSGLAATLSDAITQDQPLTFDSAATTRTIFDGEAISTFDASATDPDGDTITYSISTGSLPSGLSLNTSTGDITGTPSGNSNGDFTFTVSAASPGLTITKDCTFTQISLPTGGTINTYGNYRSHTFNSSGSWVNTLTGTAEYMICAAGGGGACASGGAGAAGGGGGAGGMIVSSTSVTPQTYTITVGGGGGGSSNNTSGAGQGGDGGDSSALSVTATGGGGGGPRDLPGRDGGSGGGTNYGDQVANSQGSGTAGQGNDGGDGGNIPSPSVGGGGGGKANVGETRSYNETAAGGAGGDALNNLYSTGSNIAYAGGGGGGGGFNAGGAGGAASGVRVGANGADGDGVNSSRSFSAPNNAVTNRGGGGGGSSGTGNGSNGSSGQVVIRYDLSNL